MCLQVGISSAKPNDFTFTFRGLRPRGGKTDIHAHGFGVAIYEGPGLRCFHDTQPAFRSPLAQWIQDHPIPTHNMMAHIRYATSGDISLANVHPFSRELWGIPWSFVHNGHVPKFDDSTPQEDQPLLGKTQHNQVQYHPVGDTDSEAAFCAILNALKAEFNTLPTLPVLHEFLSRVCQEIVRGEEDSTIFNFLLGCGEYTMFAYSWPGQRPGSKVWNGLNYLVREPPFATAKLIDVDYSIDFREFAKPDDRVAVIATKPLTSEPGWREFERGQLIMFDKGVPYPTAQCCELVEKEGRGLRSRYFAHQKAIQMRSSKGCGTKIRNRIDTTRSNERIFLIVVVMVVYYCYLHSTLLWNFWNKHNYSCKQHTTE